MRGSPEMDGNHGEQTVGPGKGPELGSETQI